MLLPTLNNVVLQFMASSDEDNTLIAEVIKTSGQLCTFSEGSHVVINYLDANFVTIGGKRLILISKDKVLGVLQ